MKKGMAFYYLSVLFILLYINQAGASDLSIGRMRVAVWPEYDDPGILVIYDGRFKDEGLFPAETTFLVPKNAAISDACSLSPKGQHFCQLYKQKNAGDADEVRLKLPYPNFYLSFHINPFKEKKESKDFTYTVHMNHAADKLEVDIQRPLRAEAFKATPQASEVSEKKGFEHYLYLFENVSKGKAVDFKVEYVKKDSKPSIDIKYSPMSGPKTWSSPYETPRRVSAILYTAGVLGLLLVIGLLWFVFKKKR
ncbi:MAG: hypothetical protein HY026_00410 [Deltaproteobacteria bacterium]|nr:hypothetical protein [Deltaproteobacteria bacterium]